jgi:negative regulator of sigma E activity
MAQERFKLTTQNYRGRILGTEIINGRPAQIVELQPRWPAAGASGPMKRLWIDRNNGLTLRVDSYNYQARLVMTSELSQVDLNPNTNDVFVPPVRMHDAADVTPWMAVEMGNHIKEVALKTGIYPPQPGYRPRGFKFDSVGVHHCTDMGAKVVAALARYSDGINVLTIFAMRPDVKLPGASGQVTGGVNKAKSPKRQSCDFGMGTMVMRSLPEGRLVAVADLPPQTLDRVLNSTRISFVAPGKTANNTAAKSAAANDNRKP